MLRQILVMSAVVNFFVFAAAFYVAKKQVDDRSGSRKSTYKMLWQQQDLFPPWFKVYCGLFVLHILATYLAVS